MIYNFYPADIKGNYINDPNATFNLVRNPNVVIAGTILAPQGKLFISEHLRSKLSLTA